jgi:hypothetical protein
LKTGERMRRHRLRLGHKLILFVACLSIGTTSYGGSAPFSFYREADNLEYLCFDSDIFKYARMTQIGRIHLSVKDFEYGSGDARALGVFFDTDDLVHSNAKMYDRFVESVKTHNRAAIIDFGIEAEYRGKSRSCVSNLDGTAGLEGIEKCHAEATAFIGAKHGNSIGQFYCNIQIKGMNYPVLTYSSCSVNADIRLEYNRRFELTDINAFEPSTIEVGLIRMLDEHIRNLSDVFALAAKCD